MYTIIEVWTPRPEFSALSAEAKKEFFTNIGGAFEALDMLGVSCQGWGRVQPLDDHAVDHAWLAVWNAPDRPAAAVFLRGVQESGWYDYFEQRVAAAELLPVPAAIEQHL